MHHCWDRGKRSRYLLLGSEARQLSGFAELTSFFLELIELDCTTRLCWMIGMIQEVKMLDLLPLRQSRDSPPFPHSLWTEETVLEREACFRLYDIYSMSVWAKQLSDVWHTEESEWLRAVLHRTLHERVHKQRNYLLDRRQPQESGISKAIPIVLVLYGVNSEGTYDRVHFKKSKVGRFRNEVFSTRFARFILSADWTGVHT